MSKIICKSRELSAPQGVEPGVGVLFVPTQAISMLHSRPVDPVGIPGGVPSSLLPPLFPLGRCAAIFIQRGAA